MKKILALILIVVAVHADLNAQSIERSVISSFGISYSGATLQSDATLGETITFTGSGGNIKITQGFHQPPAVLLTCYGDFDFNGVVNTADLLLFMGSFGCMSSCGIYDANDDGVVNTSDLLLFMGAFGNEC